MLLMSDLPKPSSLVSSNGVHAILKVSEGDVALLSRGGETELQRHRGEAWTGQRGPGRMRGSTGRMRGSSQMSPADWSRCSNGEFLDILVFPRNTHLETTPSEIIRMIFVAIYVSLIKSLCFCFFRVPF